MAVHDVCIQKFYCSKHLNFNIVFKNKIQGSMQFLNHFVLVVYICK